MVDHHEDTFPEVLTADLVRLSKELRFRAVDPALVARIVRALGEQPLGRFDRVSAALNVYLGFYAPPPKASFSDGWRRWFSAAAVPERAAGALNVAPGIEYLYLFHHSGWFREAALQKLHGGVTSPFWIAVIAYRLNDWVPQVRSAAAEAFDRTVQQAPADAIAKALIHLSSTARNWQRSTLGWQKLSALHQRSDVAGAIVRSIVGRPTGPLTRVLRDLLSSDAIDAHLLTIVREAVQPGLRALALQTLLNGEAKWPVGRRRRWIDKSMGQSRYEPCFASRPVQRPCSFETLLEIGAADRSSLVRQAAASGLIAHEEMSADPLKWAGRFASDAHVRVRERGEFLSKRRARG
jgi:hypothetical protein